MHHRSGIIISLLLLHTNLILGSNISNRTITTMEQQQELIDNNHRLLSNLTVVEYDYYGIEQLNDTIIPEETTEIIHSKVYKEIPISTKLVNALLFNVTISTTTMTTPTTTTTASTSADVLIHNSTLTMNDTYTIQIINDTSINNIQQLNLTQYTTHATFDFKLNLSSLKKLIGNLVVYYILLLICVLVLAMLFFIAICVYFKISNSYMKQRVTKSLLRRKKNLSFDVIDQGYKLNRNTDHILNRIDSNYFPILVDEAPRPLGEISEDFNENMYELPYTLDTDIEASNNLRTFGEEATKRNSAQMTSFNYGNVNVNNNPGNSSNSNKLNFIYADSDEMNKTYLDDRYKDFCHRDEIYFRSSSNSNMFNPTLVSQCLDYESASDLILNSSSVKNSKNGY